MVRPGRDRLAEWVEVDEIYVGGKASGAPGRKLEKKAFVAVAAEETEAGVGCVRLKRIPDDSAASLETFIPETVEPGSIMRTDGWCSYSKLHALGYLHEASVTGGDPDRIDSDFPRVRRVASLLKRWLLGTHQVAVTHKYLDYYLDEFTFRFNRRNSRSQGQLFYRLLQQAVATAPAHVCRRSCVPRFRTLPHAATGLKYLSPTTTYSVYGS